MVAFELMALRISRGSDRTLAAATQVAEAAAGWPASPPYDTIILNGATEIAPKALFEQLAEGGRLVGVWAANRPSRAMIVTHSRGDFGSRVLFDAAAPILPGLERRPEFVF